METIYLAHHGVKGQRWGVRKDKAAKAFGIGLTKGLVIGLAKYALSMSNPQLFGIATASIIGRQVVKSILSKMAMTYVRQITGTEEVKIGKMFVDKMLKR